MASNYPTSLDNFTNPTSNDSLNSPSHSLQHADANDAIEALQRKVGIGSSTAGSATAGQVLTAGTGGTTTWTTPTEPGLTLVKTQTIGSAVSSVEVTSAFSATYDAYKVIVTSGVNSAGGQVLSMRMGSSTTNYAGTVLYGPITGSGNASYVAFGTTLWRIAGGLTTNYIDCTFEIRNPFLSKYTLTSGNWTDGVNAGTWQGIHNDASSYTAFTLIPEVGTLTGGTIRVYGYRNS